MTATGTQSSSQARIDITPVDGTDVSLAVREYVQNQVGQVLKEMETLEWSNWSHTYLEETATHEERQILKRKIVSLYPSLLTGPHGSRLRMDSEWLPEYVVTTKISRDTLKKTPHTSDLEICNVIWRHATTKIIALSFFNNHLDTDASFATFVTPGASTSRESLWAAGQNGKGFLTATQFFQRVVEKVRQELHSDVATLLGISFRVGHDIGEVCRETSKCSSCPSPIVVNLDELFPLNPSELQAKRSLTDQDAAMEVASMSRRRMMYNMSRPRATTKGENEVRQGLFHEESVVKSDEVSINIIGLPSDITPEVIFCGTLGLFKPSTMWKIPNALFEFFKTPMNVPLLYYRGQLMPCAHTGLAQIGVNYLGTLEICPESSRVKKDHVLYQRYHHLLREAIQYAFCHLPELAVELACDITRPSTGSDSRMFEMFTPKPEHDAAYKSAFYAAWQRMRPGCPVNRRFYPCRESALEDLRLIEEFDMIGQPVLDQVMDQVIVPSGAFLPIKEHAEGVFLHRRGVGSGFVGFTQFRRAILEVFSWAANSDIVMVDYTNSYPKILWDDRTKQFVLGIPSCNLHPEECSCWVAPYLLEARDTYCKRSTNKDKGEVADLSYGVLFRAYALAMGADPNQVDDKAKGPLAKKRKTPPVSKHSDQQELAKRPRSEAQNGEPSSLDTRDESDMDTDSSPDPPSSPRPPRADKASGSELMSSVAVEPTLFGAAIAATMNPSDILSHPLAEFFEPIMHAYDRNLDALSAQAARFELQRQRFVADNVQKEEDISTLRAQVAEERAKAQCFRAQLQAVQTERDQTRDLLVAKWRQSKP